MNTDDPREIEQLISYRLGALDNDEQIREIRSSSSAMSWLRNYRFIQILAKGSDDANKGAGIDNEKLVDFWNEKLPPKEMLEVEKSLTNDPLLFDEYLSIRLEGLSENSEPVPLELDDLVRNMVLSEKKPQEQSDKEKKPTSSWTNSIAEFFDRIFSPHNMGWAGGVAVVTLVVIFGSNQLIQQNGQQFPPLIIASLEPSEMPLSFRGGQMDYSPIYGEKGEPLFVKFEASNIFANALIKFSDAPSKETFLVLIEAINNAAIWSKDNASTRKLSKFSPNNIDTIQVAPNFIARIKTSKYIGESAYAAIEKMRTKEDMYQNTQKKFANILYLFSDD